MLKNNSGGRFSSVLARAFSHGHLCLWLKSRKVPESPEDNCDCWFSLVCILNKFLAPTLSDVLLSPCPPTPRAV